MLITTLEHFPENKKQQLEELHKENDKFYLKIRENKEEKRFISNNLEKAEQELYTVSNTEISLNDAKKWYKYHSGFDLPFAKETHEKS